MNRRDFLENGLLSTGLIAGLGFETFAAKKEWFEISLAEWSVHKAIFGGTLDNLDFPKKAKEDFGINIVEYVNTCFKSKTKDFKANGADDNYLKELMKRCQDLGVRNHLIMCDAEGNLGEAELTKRKETVENHHKWVNAAKHLGCKTIRVNAGGKGTAEEVAKTAADGLHMLGEYAAQYNINVIVENHGSYSSNGKWLSGVMKSVNLPNVGTLPDFGNFCMKYGPNYASCEESYDRYLGTEELMPFAKGVSAKTNDFNEKGEEVKMDYKRLLKIVKKAGFRGIVGIEYEGQKLGEDEGIRATLALLKKYQRS